MSSPLLQSSELSLGNFKGKEADKRYHLRRTADLFHQRAPTIASGDPKAKMEEIRHYVHSTWELFDAIFESISSEEGFLVAPIHKLRHPMIFYYGHTASFYINKLCVAGLTSHIDPLKEEMFAIGVDEMSWDDLHESHYDWPSPASVSAYRNKVRDTIDGMMRSGKYPLSLPLTFDSSTQNESNAFWWVMLMGAEHERIHIETASVHLRELPMQYVKESMSPFWKRCPVMNTRISQTKNDPRRLPENSLVEFPGGTTRMGRPVNCNLYGWDSDYSCTGNDSDVIRTGAPLEVTVAPFKASKFLVTNVEFLSFVQDGGYSKREYWDEEGWAWVTSKKPEHPWFWVPDPSVLIQFRLRLLTELIELPLDWPCEMNHLEARAFCNYKSAKDGIPNVRMLTEAEWLYLFDTCVGRDHDEWGSKPSPGNLNMEHFCSSCPVTLFRHGELYDVVGNVWQHTEDMVYPYPGYREHPFYDDFSRPTFDGRHACMKGGAWVSTGNEATRDARFAFRRHFFQFIGLRYVVGEPYQPRAVEAVKGGVDADVDCITDCHFSAQLKEDEGPAAIARYALAAFKEHANGLPAKRVLDLLCGAGRVTFELAAMFEEPIGVDFSARRLIPAYALLERGTCEYMSNRGTDSAAMQTVKADGYPWAATRKKARFFQSDPVNLHKHLSQFSMIVCWNCLENTYQPSAVPAHLLSRLIPGGILVLGTDGAFKSGASRQQPSYLNDELVLKEGTEPVHDTLFACLGGDAAVERVGSPLDVPVTFRRTGEADEVKTVHFATYRKR